jgi:hypothetical protein
LSPLPILQYFIGRAFSIVDDDGAVGGTTSIRRNRNISWKINFLLPKK